MSQSYKYSKRAFFAMAASAFAGMLVAVPMVIAVYAPHDTESETEKTQDQTVTATAENTAATCSGHVSPSDSSGESTLQIGPAITRPFSGRGSIGWQ